MIFDILLTVTAILSILIVGVCFLVFFIKKFTFKGLELLGYGVVCGVLIYAIIGLIIVNIGFNQQKVVTVIFVAINTLSLFYFLKKKLFSQVVLCDKLFSISAFVGWVSMSLICVFISNVNIKFPDKLFDGPYVIKNHNLHVKVQVITGNLPADNYIPYLVGEFLLRGISFKEERPLMPGQEISNRPILMALVTVPFRAMLIPAIQQNEPLPKFQYVGTLWPDVGVLGEDKYFRIFLTVGIILNAMFIIPVILLFKKFGVGREYVIAGVLLIIFNPYFISQTLFTWPKEMAAFFIMLATYTLISYGSPIIVGLLLALSYHSHPYSIVFAGSFGIFFLLQNWKTNIIEKQTVFSKKEVFLEWASSLKKAMFSRQVLLYSSTFILVVLPWFIWTRLVLSISSDLISQNLFSGGSLKSNIWVRFYNFYNTIFPRFFDIFPLNWESMTQVCLVNLSGIIGVIFFIQAFLACKKYYSQQRVVVIYNILLPGALLISIFSSPAVPALHGFQAIAPILILLSLKWMQDNLSKKFLVIFVVLQLAINFAMLNGRIKTLGVFSETKVSMNVLSSNV